MLDISKQVAGLAPRALGRLVLSVVCALASESASWSAPPDASPAIRAMAAVIDVRRSPEERMASLQVLLALPKNERRAGLLAVVEKADEDLSVVAARTLLEDGAAEAIPSLCNALAGWSENGRLVILQTIVQLSGLQAVPRALLAVPRQVLGEPPPRTAGEPDGPASSRELAAILLAQSDDPADVDRLRQAVLAKPGLRGFWLALALQGLPPDEQLLARTVYQDESRPQVVRCAAAAALASSDPAAAAFFRQGLESFLARFGSRTMAEILQASGVERTAYFEFRRDLRLIGMLRFVSGGEGEPLTFQALVAKNELIRSTAALIAAVRWPDRLLSQGLEGLTDDERPKVAAVVVLLHPNRRTLVTKGMKSGALDQGLEDLRKGGMIGAFGMAGAIGAGF